MTDSSAFLTVTSATPDDPVWIGAVVTAVVATLAVVLWARRTRPGRLLDPTTAAVAAVAALLWGAFTWWSLPDDPTVSEAVQSAFGITLDDDPDDDDVADGAKLLGTAGPDRATCFMTPAPVDTPERTFDPARLTFVVSGTVVMTCTAGPPPPDLGGADLTPPEPPAEVPAPTPTEAAPTAPMEGSPGFSDLAPPAPGL